MMTEYMLPGVPVQWHNDQLKIEIRMPWYRALPLSSVNKVQVYLDGEVVPMDEAKLAVNETEYKLDELPSLWQEWWYVLDSAYLILPAPAGLTAGSHDVRLHLGLFIPYLPMGPFILNLEEDFTKKLEVVAA